MKTARQRYSSNSPRTRNVRHETLRRNRALQAVGTKRSQVALDRFQTWAHPGATIAVPARILCKQSYKASESAGTCVRSTSRSSTR